MKTLSAVLMLLCFPTAALPADNADAEIRSLMDHQVDDWNKGDLPHFVSHYADSATIIGKTIETRTRAQILEHYRTAYGTGSRMGKLTFTHLEIKPLDEHVAIATANWHVERDVQSGGPVGGVFSIVLKHEGQDWLIVLDHTN